MTGNKEPVKRSGMSDEAYIWLIALIIIAGVTIGLTMGRK